VGDGHRAGRLRHRRCGSHRRRRLGRDKIGTYALALAAHRHDIPFIVVAPESTRDLETATGREIVVEERAAAEITHVGGVATAPEHTAVFNPAFDVTPAALVTAIVTENGVVASPGMRWRSPRARSSSTNIAIPRTRCASLSRAEPVYLHLEPEVFALVCEGGDVLSVPAGTRHWFDMGSEPDFVAIRFFEQEDGWVGDFTGDAIGERFPTLDQLVAT